MMQLVYPVPTPCTPRLNMFLTLKRMPVPTLTQTGCNLYEHVNKKKPNLEAVYVLFNVTYIYIFEILDLKNLNF